MISLQHLYKSFTKHHCKHTVFEDYSIELPEKGLIAICGESGCGKTTLLNCIGGLDSFRGAVWINDKRIQNAPSRNDCFRQSNLGFVFQDNNLLEKETVKYNLQLSIDIARTSSDQDEVRIIEALNAVGMGKYLKRKISTLSGGQKQRVAIARAIINSPMLLLADEPTGHLDTENARSVLNILKNLSQSIPVIWVSHEKQLVKCYADYILTLPDGILKSNTALSQSNAARADVDRPSLPPPVVPTSQVKTELVQAGPLTIQFSYAENTAKAVLSLLAEGNIIRISFDEPTNIVLQKAIPLPPSIEKTEPQPAIQSSPSPLPYHFENVKRTGKKSNAKMRNNTAYREKWLSVLAFVLASACLSFAFSFSIAEKVSSEWQYLAPTQNTVQIDFLNPVTPTDIKTIRETENVLYMLPYSTPIAYTLTDATVMQTQSNSWSMRDRAFFIPDSNADSLILGKIPTSPLEILLDEKLAEEMLADSNPEYPASVLGYTGLQNFLGAKITFDTLTSEYTVVGITKSRFPVYYVSEDTLQTIAIGVSLQSPFDVVSQANYISSSGEKIPLKDNEIVISQDLARDLSVNISDTMTFLETPYAVRSIRSDAQNSVFLNEINMESISEKLCFSEIQTLLVLTDDGQNTAASLSDKGYNAIACADITEADAQNNFRQRVLVSRIVFGLILFCAGIALFLSEKGRMLVQKKSYTVRRTLGLSGNRILFTDMLCSLKKACFIAIPLYSLLVLLMNKIAIALHNVLPFVQISFPKYLLGIGILFLLTVLSTALAEWKYYRMTPATLLKG